MTYCRQGHTLVDNEAEAGWEKLVPGTFFELLVNAITYFGTVDEYTAPTPTTLVCRLYTDSGRTILLTTAIPTGLPYAVSAFVSYSWRKEDLQASTRGDIGTYLSPPVVVRDDTGSWVGNWVAEPKTEEQDSEVEFKFEGTHTLFTATVDQPIISEQAGVGLGAGTFQYCIVPVDGSSRLGAGSRILTITLAGPADVFIDWLPNNQVSNWNVYGRQIGGSFGLMATLPGATVSYVDDNTDVPNPAFQPPLFEDPAWTVAVANRTVSISDSGIDSTGDISEDAIQLGETGQVFADASDVGGISLNNTVAGLSFDLSNVESTVEITENVVLDPNLFINSPLPPDQQTYTIQYDFHVFTNDAGLKVIEETDSQTGQTKTITIDITAQTMQIEIIENAVVLSDDTIALDPRYTIPDDISMSSTITYDGVRVLPDGTIIGKETIEANTYNVTPQLSPGIMMVGSGFIFTPYNQEIAWSADSAISWQKFSPASRVVLPAGFFIAFTRPETCLAHGHGWTVIASRDGFSSNDMAMHWTNDLNANPWPFNDSQGRVAGGDPVNAAVSFWKGSDSSIGANHNDVKRWDIVQFANGLGPVLIHNVHSDDIFATNAEYHFFFPATGVMTHVPSFTFPSATDKTPFMFWPEKNLLIAKNRFSSPTNIYKYDITTNPAAPVINEVLVHNLPVTGSIQEIMFFCTRDMMGIVYRQSVGDIYRMSTTLDGTSWNDTTLGAFPRVGGDVIVNANLPASHPLAIYPGYLSDPLRDGRIMYHANTQDVYVSLDNAATFNLITPTGNVPADFDGSDWGPHNFVGDLSVNGLRHAMAVPFIWDGITLASHGPDDASTTTLANTMHRMDANLVAQSPKHGGSMSLNNPRVENIVVGATLGSPSSNNGIPAANLRRYIGRSVVIPTGVASTPSPFNIRDTTKSAVYSGRNTRDYDNDPGFMNIVIQTIERGGIGNATFTKIEDGQQVMRDVPSNLPGDSFDKWKNPPINMTWTAKF